MHDSDRECNVCVCVCVRASRGAHACMRRWARCLGGERRGGGDGVRVRKRGGRREVGFKDKGVRGKEAMGGKEERGRRTTPPDEFQARTCTPLRVADNGIFLAGGWCVMSIPGNKVLFNGVSWCLTLSKKAICIETVLKKGKKNGREAQFDTRNRTGFHSWEHIAT